MPKPLPPSRPPPPPRAPSTRAAEGPGPASAPGAVVLHPTLRWSAAEGFRPGGPPSDPIAVEAPLEVRFRGRAATVVLRTPGEDDDLVRGFLLAEGMIRGPEDVLRIERPAGLTGDEAGNVVDVTLAPSRAGRTLDRPLYSSSSCGACGKRSLASLRLEVAPLAEGPRVPAATLALLPQRMAAAQPAFARTGGLHACGLFTAAGELVVVREDVGRHNAVDKVVGWAMTQRGLPLSDHVLQVSGRISFELAQKAAAAGVPILAAVGAPSSRAIEVAQGYGLTLVGFARPASLNVYTHPERVAP